MNTPKTTASIGIGSLAASLPALAQPYDMMGAGYGMMSGGYAWMGFVGLVYLVLAALVFSIIFWWVHSWMTKDTNTQRTQRKRK